MNKPFSSMLQNEIYIPANSDPTSDQMAVFLSELQAATAVTDERRSGHWIGIHSKQLRTLIGREYVKVIHESEKLGFIECNPRYSVGRFCKSMRLAERYRTPVCDPYRLQRQRPIASRQRIRIEPSDDTGIALAACFAQARIPLDTDTSGWDSYCCRAIQQRDWYAVRCPYNRFHSSFTGLPKSVRERIEIAGEPVVELDIANCQPLILGVLTARKISTTYGESAGGCGVSAGCGGVGRFLTLCSQGILYEYLRDRSLPKRSRAEIKREFLIMLFAKNATTKRLPLFEIFATDFPSVANFVIEAKRQEYQNLARDCQRFESKLMIDNVARICLQNVPVITIHDSIIVARSTEQLVSDVIRKQFGSIGVGVTIRRTVTSNGGRKV